MSDIKFRAWMTNDAYPTGHMYTPDRNPQFVISFHGNVVEVCDGNKLVWARIGNHGVSLMQFTGLHDKNGEEIYEGDIVRFPICPVHRRGTDASRCVSWSDFQYTLTRVVNGKHETDYWLGYGDHEIEPGKLEVMGNIYQNPELLSNVSA